nr:hypothetical protein [Pedobacter sp. ASV19]
MATSKCINVDKWHVCYEDFFKKIEGDPIVRTGHLAVFSALFFMALINGEKGTVRATSWEVMAVAKISSQITYLRIIADLAQLGYVKYRPSLSKFHRSEIRILGLNNQRKEEGTNGQRKQGGKPTSFSPATSIKG